MIPVPDLNTVNSVGSDQIAAKLHERLNHGRCIRGESGQHFEKEYAFCSKTRHAEGTGSGLDALTLRFCGYASCKSRLNEINTPFVRVELAQLNADNENRMLIGERYLRGVHNAAARWPLTAPVATHVWHLFVVPMAEREQLPPFLPEPGAETTVHFPIPTHKQKAFP